MSGVGGGVVVGLVLNKFCFAKTKIFDGQE